MWLVCQLLAVSVYAETMHYSAGLEVGAIGPFMKAAPRQSAYAPFVEEGKMWKYVLRNGGIPHVDYPDACMIIRIGNAVEIDGVEYHALNQYIGDCENPDEETLLGYLREDVEAGQVLFRIPDSFNSWQFDRPFAMYELGEEVILYDFRNPADMRDHQNIEENLWNADERHEFKALDGSMRSAAYYDSRLMIVEGLGWLQIAAECAPDVIGYGYTGDIFGESVVRASAAPHYLPYLYEIRDGVGTVLFSQESNRFMASVDDVIEGDGCRIVHSGTRITVTCAMAAIGEISVVSAGGTVVRRFNIASHEFTFDMEGYMPGTYIVKAGTGTVKIVVN